MKANTVTTSGQGNRSPKGNFWILSLPNALRFRFMHGLKRRMLAKKVLFVFVRFWLPQHHAQRCFVKGPLQNKKKKEKTCRKSFDFSYVPHNTQSCERHTRAHTHTHTLAHSSINKYSTVQVGKITAKRNSSSEICNLQRT